MHFDSQKYMMDGWKDTYQMENTQTMSQADVDVCIDLTDSQT